MSEPVSVPSPLQGCRVAITGRLSTLSREEAIALVQQLGAEYVPHVDPQTTHLLVGERGWPLSRSGRLTSAFRRAARYQRMGRPLEIIREHDFLVRFHLGDEAGAIQHYTLQELTRMTGIRRARLADWTSRGWVVPAEVRNNIPYYDYRQVVGLRHLAHLMAAGVTTRRLSQSLAQLKAWLPQSEQALAQLTNLMSGNGDLLTRTPEGRLAEPSGQLRLDFEPAPSQPVNLGEHQPYEKLVDEALALESSGRMAEAAVLYQKLLTRWPQDAQLWFNYGNTLYAQGQNSEAESAFRKAVEHHPEHAEAWNNLGVVLMDREQWPSAGDAFRRAIAIDPTNEDARCNLADVLVERELQSP